MRNLCLGLAAFVLGLPALAAQEKSFAVRWYGQSFFTVTTPSGKTIAFDPHVMREFERKDPVAADFVCVSHPHNDHDRVEEGIVDGKDDKKVKVFQGLKIEKDKPTKPPEWNKIDEKTKVGDGTIRIRAFGCYHDEMSGLKRGKNSAFIVEADGLTFCHLGDLGHGFTEAEAKLIGPIDVLFIPIGGTYTLNGEVAKEVIESLKPRLYTIPMHYSYDGNPDTLVGSDEFLDGMKNLKKMEDSNELLISAKPQVDKMATVILNWKKKEK